MVGPYEKEAKRFVKVATWLEDSDQLMVLHLKTIAKSLDNQLEADGSVQSALANTFGVTLRSLESRKPKAQAKDEEDADEDLHFS